LTKKSVFPICVTLLALLTAFVLSACSPGGVSSPDGANNQENTGDQVSSTSNQNDSLTQNTPDNGDSSSGGEPVATEGSVDMIDMIPSYWQVSAHAQTYVVNADGENSACTQCHAPVNYVPPLDEIPDSCFVCKFEVSVPPPLIDQDVWTNINCNICHETDRKRNILPEYKWLEVPILLEYAEVATSTELCLKCHVQSDLPGHKPQPNLANAHADMVCSDCHDAHNLEAGCSTGDCHADVLAGGETIEGHDQDHQLVSCVACHQTGGLPFGMTDDSGEWLPLISITPIGSDPDLVTYSSHDIVRESACDRCHFSGNPWDLNIY